MILIKSLKQKAHPSPRDPENNELKQRSRRRGQAGIRASCKDSDQVFVSSDPGTESWEWPLSDRKTDTKDRQDRECGCFPSGREVGYQTDKPGWGGLASATTETLGQRAAASSSSLRGKVLCNLGWPQTH